jgi:lipopolysaccharide/colanic/teichoic acid biosynthesis glycosyltransferase
MKRFFDIIISLILIVLFSPLFLVIAFFVFLNFGFPIIFVQLRPGLNSRKFNMYKFRTMTNAKDEQGQLLLDNERLSKIGNFLRTSSLDELPELVNVFIGDMSLVGPRPLLNEYLSLYNKRQARRHEVRPGITGFAQINGRNQITWEEKFELDVWYVDNKSIWLDFKILFFTITKVIAREGINSSNEMIMPHFKGSKNGDLD